MQKLKINFIVCNPDLSGGNRIIAEHSRYLKNAGHHVNVIGVDTHRDTPRSVLRCLVKQGRLPGSDICTQHFDEVGTHVTVIKRQCGPAIADIPDADITIATWWETAEWIEKLPASKGKKVYFIQGYEPFFQGAKNPQRVEATYRLPYSQIGVCRWLCNEIEKVRGPDFNQGPCVLVENGVDLKRFNAPERAKQTTPTLGYMYSPASFKNPDLAIETLHAIKRDLPQTRFVVFGAHEPIKGHSFPEDTSFTKRPAQSQIPKLYSNCDAWLLTSDHEGFGLPIVEALACRTPVVSTHAGIGIEILNDTNGRLVNERTSKAIAAAAIDILSLPTRDWLRCSENAWIAAQKFTWARSARLFEQALFRAVDHIEGENNEYSDAHPIANHLSTS